MVIKKKRYRIPLYTYYHYDNTWTLADFIMVECCNEPVVVSKKQHSIGRDENDNPLIKFRLIYDHEEINQIDQSMQELNQTSIVGIIYKINN